MQRGADAKPGSELFISATHDHLMGVDMSLSLNKSESWLPAFPFPLPYGVTAPHDYLIVLHLA